MIRMGKSEKIITLLSIALLIGIGLAFVGNQIYKKRLAELEEIIKGQKEKISQLEQQGVKTEQDSQARDKAIAKEFLKKWKIVIGRDAPYSEVVVSGGVMKIHFSDVYEATAFINFTPEVIARFALDYFLRETGRKTGTVEYYTPLKKKIFSMSGNPSGEETKVYYKEGMKE